MKKYTLEEIKNNRIIVNCNTQEQAHKIINLWKLDKRYPRHDFQKSEDFHILYNNQTDLHWNQRLDNNKSYFETRHTTYNPGGSIHFSQIDFQDTPVSVLDTLELW